MRPKAIGFAAILSLTTSGAALAAPGPEAACNALAEQARQALVLKKQGLALDKAITVLSSQPVPDSVPAGQADFFRNHLPGAARFAYVAGMSSDGTAQYYLKQCLKGA
jgi:hypothetical protein